MKTYIVLTSNGYVATLAGNKTEAYNKVKSAFPNRKVNKGNVNISSVHIDYVTFDKIA